MPDFILSDEIIKKNIQLNDTVIIALSGGPDSMCLLDLLIKYREEINIKIIAAHVHHNVRKESDDELLFVKDYCKKNNIIFESMKIDNYYGDNFESEARRIRYNFFNKLQKKYSSKFLLTAHHGDDLIETILMRIVRGSNLKGYSGFEELTKYKDYYILRPLIFMTKDDIIQYNKANNIPYVIDYTNELDVHTRNRYRKYILPKLKQENKDVHLKFIKFSKLLLEYNNHIENEVKNIVDKIYINDKLNIIEFNFYDNFIKKRIINLILNKIYKDDISYLKDKNVDEIISLIESNSSNAVLDLPKNRKAIKSYDKFYVVEKSVEKLNNESFCYEFNNKIILPNNKIIEKVAEEDSNSNYVCRIYSKDIKLPIIIRTKKDGDYLTVMNMKGHKKLKDIFINAKIPINERNTWPIVTDSDNNILWVPGIKKTKYNKQNDEKYDIILKYY